MSQQPTRERIIVAHRAGTATEAVVIRSLLESVGIASPDPVFSKPFPMREPPAGFCDTDILAFESEADEARRVIADYFSPANSLQIEESPRSTDSSGTKDASS